MVQAEIIELCFLMQTDWPALWIVGDLIQTLGIIHEPVKTLFPDIFPTEVCGLICCFHSEVCVFSQHAK